MTADRRLLAANSIHAKDPAKVEAACAGTGAGLAKEHASMRRDYRLIIEQESQGSPLFVRVVSTDGHRGVVAESNPKTAIALRTAFRQVAAELAEHRDEHGELP